MCSTELEYRSRCSAERRARELMVNLDERADAAAILLRCREKATPGML